MFIARIQISPLPSLHINFFIYELTKYARYVIVITIRLNGQFKRVRPFVISSKEERASPAPSGPILWRGVQGQQGRGPFLFSNQKNSEFQSRPNFKFQKSKSILQIEVRTIFQSLMPNGFKRFRTLLGILMQMGI